MSFDLVGADSKADPSLKSVVDSWSNVKLTKATPVTEDVLTKLAETRAPEVKPTVRGELIPVTPQLYSQRQEMGYSKSVVPGHSLTTLGRVLAVGLGLTLATAPFLGVFLLLRYYLKNR